MSLVANPARPRNHKRTRQFLSQRTISVVSEQVLSTSQAPSSVGSQYRSQRITFTPTSIGASCSGWIREFDKYRVTKAELHVTYTAAVDAPGTADLFTLPVVHYAFCDEDSGASAGATVAWQQVHDRENLSRVVLRANAPSVCVATWTPKVLYEAPQTSNSPANVVPPSNMWLDSLATGQEFSGVSCFSFTPATVDVSRGRYRLDYELRVTVEASNPL